jgi:hypothetical protein
MFNFYVCIPTIKGYEIALNNLLNSFPNEWKEKYILIYQNEITEKITIFEDGHIEVYINNNLHDYGGWIGINKLLEKNIVPNNSCFLFIHDTCKFGDNSYKLTSHIANVFMNESDYDVMWLSKLGQCNICLIKERGIRYGYNVYKDIKTVTKIEGVKWEWDPYHPNSPKAFEIKHYFIPVDTEKLGKRQVYSNTERNVLLYKTIDLEKYFVDIVNESDHPYSP